MVDLLTPSELRQAAQAKELARARELADADRRRAEERSHVQQAFVERQIRADAKERLRAALVAAAERGEDHIQVVTFPSELCTDRGRAINNSEPNWPETLIGFAARTYEFYKIELQPHGYKLRAEILNYPGGMPGEVAIILAW